MEALREQIAHSGARVYHWDHTSRASGDSMCEDTHVVRYALLALRAICMPLRDVTDLHITATAILEFCNPHLPDDSTTASPILRQPARSAG